MKNTPQRGDQQPIHAFRLAVRDARGLDREVRLLLHTLATYADSQTLECWPSNERLADDLDATIRGVQKWRSAARAAGWIEQTGERRGKIPVVRLAIPSPEDGCTVVQVNSGSGEQPCAIGVNSRSPRTRQGTRQSSSSLRSSSSTTGERSFLPEKRGDTSVTHEQVDDPLAFLPGDPLPETGAREMIANAVREITGIASVPQGALGQATIAMVHGANRDGDEIEWAGEPVPDDVLVDWASRMARLEVQQNGCDVFRFSERICWFMAKRFIAARAEGKIPEMSDEQKKAAKKAASIESARKILGDDW